MHGSPPASIVRYRGLVPRTEPLGPIGPAQAVVAVEGCALGPHDARPDAAVCPGGAAVGTIVVGPPEHADWVGRRVLVPEVLPCGECAVCQRGRAPACPQAARLGVDVDGTLASHVVCAARYLVPADGELAPTVPAWMLAAVAGPAGRIHHAIARAGVGPGDLALFLGDTACAHFGAAIVRAKAGLALIRPAATTRAEVQNALGDTNPRGWHVFETTGAEGAAEAAARLSSPTGTLSLAGAPAEGSVTLPRAALLETPLLVTSAPHPDLLTELLALVVRGDLTLEDHVRALDLEGLGTVPFSAPSPVCHIFRPPTS
jgi:6-hydroxycyclohex-1-ene-1-carbonyl-CoA dehydrogenase